MKRMNLLWMFLLMLAGTSNLKAQATLVIPDFQISRGETKTVGLEMNNTVEVRAFQVQVVLPKNLKLAAPPTVNPARQGIALDETGQETEATKTLSYNVWEDGSLMIVVNAYDAVPFAGTKGTVINLPLTAAEETFVGATAIELRDMELVFADGRSYVRPEDSSCQVEIREAVTSVSQLKEVCQKPVDVYNLDGAMIKSNVPVNKLERVLPRGVYVIEGYKIVIEK